jgi:hypothetical protein
MPLTRSKAREKSGNEQDIVQMNARVPRELRDRADIAMAHLRISTTEFLCTAVEKQVEEYERGSPETHAEMARKAKSVKIEVPTEHAEDVQLFLETLNQSPDPNDPPEVAQALEILSELRRAYLKGVRNLREKSKNWYLRNTTT